MNIFEDFGKDTSSANPLGDCPICGSAVTAAEATTTNTQTGETEEYILLICSQRIEHTLMPKPDSEHWR